MPEARFIVEREQTAEYATEPKNLSLLFVAQQSAVVKDVPDTAAETMRISGGNDGLPRAMAAALGAALHLGAEVRRVESHRDHVRVLTNAGRYEPVTSRSRPAPHAASAAPSWCPAKTHPYTMVPRSRPNELLHSATVGGTVATQSRP